MIQQMRCKFYTAQEMPLPTCEALEGDPGNAGSDAAALKQSQTLFKQLYHRSPNLQAKCTCQEVLLRLHKLYVSCDFGYKRAESAFMAVERMQQHNKGSGDLHSNTP